MIFNAIKDLNKALKASFLKNCCETEKKIKKPII